MVILKIYFENAFNSIDRNVPLFQVDEKCPHFYLFMWQSYSYLSILFFGGNFISFQVCLKQRDLEGLLGISLSTQPIIQELMSGLKVW